MRFLFEGVNMDLESLSKVSDGLVDKLLKGALEVSSFFKDAYKFNLAKENYLDKISQLQYVRTLNDFEESVSYMSFMYHLIWLMLKKKKYFKLGISKILKHIEKF